MTIQEMSQKGVEFRRERDWEKFHTLKDLAMALNVEAGEAAECFLWKTGEQLKNLTDDQRKEIALEIGDVFYVLLLLSHDLGISLEDAFVKQQEKAQNKYPVDKAKGSNQKYTAYH